MSARHENSKYSRLEVTVALKIHISIYVLLTLIIYVLSMTKGSQKEVQLLKAKDELVLSQAAVLPGLFCCFILL